eukprot:88145-Amorphochlora_amoeboformis.AAC.1
MFRGAYGREDRACCPLSSRPGKIYSAMRVCIPAVKMNNAEKRGERSNIIRFERCCRWPSHQR